MLRETYFIVGEGSGARFRPDSSTMSESVTDILKDYDYPYRYKVIWSGKRKSLKEIRRIIESIPAGSNVVLILKSYSAVRWKKYFTKHYTTFRIFNKVEIIIVDGHGRAWGEKGKNKRWRCYGKRREMEFTEQEVGSNVNITAVFQHNEEKRKNPMGAKVKGPRCKNRDAGKDADHWNIVTAPVTREVISEKLEKIFEPSAMIYNF